MDLKPLSGLKRGVLGVIRELKSGELSLKLMEMGCLPGERVKVEKIAPLGDPISIRVSGYLLSLRKDEAEVILVEIEEAL